MLQKAVSIAFKNTFNLADHGFIDTHNYVLRSWLEIDYYVSFRYLEENFSLLLCSIKDN